MTRIGWFNSPFLLGFDHMEQMFDRVSKTNNDGYPPYNIQQLDTGSFRVTLALAGFKPDDIEITVEDNQLNIRGKINDDNDNAIYIHKGIANRQFRRSFLLADGIEDIAAEFDNGLLHIDLIRPKQHSRTIQIAIKQPRSISRSPILPIGHNNGNE